MSFLVFLICIFYGFSPLHLGTLSLGQSVLFNLHEITLMVLCSKQLLTVFFNPCSALSYAVHVSTCTYQQIVAFVLHLYQS